MNVLRIDLKDGACELKSFLPGEYMGPIDFFLNQAGKDSLVFGVGPLHRANLPGSHRMIVCGRSPLTKGPFVSTLGSAGMALSGMNLDAVEVFGKAEQMSVLVVGVGSGGMETRLVDADDVFGGGYVPDINDILEAVLKLATKPGAWALAAGRAGYVSLFGSLAARSLASNSISWAGRGGLGSMAVAGHGLVAVLLDSDRKRFAKGMLRSSGREFLFDPRLAEYGTLVANVEGLSDRLLCFNGRSALLEKEERIRLFDDLVRPGMLLGKSRQAKGKTCGEPCQIACRRESSGSRVDFQPFSSLGPNIGIFDGSLVSELVKECDRHGFDAVELGGILGWAIELEESGHIDFKPSTRSAMQDDCFDSAMKIMSDMAERRRPDLACGLAAASREKGADKAVLVSVRNGGIAPMQYWSPGVFAPVAPPGRYNTYFGIDYIPVSELGMLCGKRACVELALDNLGLCRFQQEWAEEQLDTLASQAGISLGSMVARHAELAMRLIQESELVEWKSARMGELVRGYLFSWQEEGDGGRDLSDWLNDFTRDFDAASRRYWHELSAGILEQGRRLSTP